MAATSIWSVKGWLGKVVIYVQNPDKTKSPEIAKLPELSGMEERETQGLSDVIAYAVNSQHDYANRRLWSRTADRIAK